MSQPVTNIRVLGAHLIVLLLGFTGGCSQPSLSQLSAFAVASESLAKNAQVALALSDDIAIDRRLHDMASAPDEGPTDATFAKPFGEHERIRVRLAVLERLGQYAGALKALASADYGSEIDDASAELYGALSGLKKTYSEASGRELNLEDSAFQLIATAVDAIGRTIVEAKRRDALKTIILASDDAVQEAATLITNDLGPDKELAKYVEASLVNVVGSLQTAYNVERERETSSFNSRLTRLHQIKAAREVADASDSYFHAVSQGAAKMASAHAALKRAVADDTFATERLAVLIGDLQDHVNAIRDFHRKLSDDRHD